MKKMKIKESFTGKKFKNGAYTTGFTIIVIAIVLFVNLIAAKLDIKMDLSEDKKFTLTKETRELVKTVTDDIAIYFIAGEDSAEPQIKNIVEKYENLSSKIKVEQKDPVLYPNFTGQYTKEEVQNNSVIVVNKTKDTSKVVPVTEMLVTEMNYQTYGEELTGIDVEGQITSAIQYVTLEKYPVMYKTTGHGEAEISDVAAKSIAKQNVTTDTLDTMKTAEIPEDCEIIFINGPQYDFSEAEAEMIKNYLISGGNVIMTNGYTEEETPNLDQLLEYYGVKKVKGIVIEGSAEYSLANTPTYLIPTYGSSEMVSKLAEENRPVILPLAAGFETLDTARDSVTVTPLLTTSDAAFSKVNVNSSNVEKEADDINGPFSVGLSVEEEYNGNTAKLVIYGSPYLLDQSMTMYSQIGNTELFLNTVSSMMKIESGIAIPSRSLGTQYLTVNALEGSIWGVITMILIPLAVLITGITVCLRRRRA